jgi:hypothetical protein
MFELHDKVRINDEGQEIWTVEQTTDTEAGKKYSVEKNGELTSRKWKSESELTLVEKFKGSKTPEATDRNLLINGLPREDVAAGLRVSPGNIRVGNLELIFDTNEKLVRLRIHGSHGWSRQYMVRDPKENLGI